MAKISMKQEENKTEFFEVNCPGLSTFDGVIYLNIPQRPVDLETCDILSDRMFEKLNEQGIYLTELTVKKMFDDIYKHIERDQLLQFLSENIELKLVPPRL